MPGPEPDPERLARRIERLRHELRDEGVPLPSDPRCAEQLLVELDYARHPSYHEGVGPRFGAILAERRLAENAAAGLASVIDCVGRDLTMVRRLADGCASFVARDPAGGVDLACFDRTVESEAAAVQLADELGAVLLQRFASGWVRLCSPEGLATWDGVQWWSRAHPADVAETVLRWVPDADRTVTEQLVEFCIQWLGASRVGAALTWCLDGDPRALTHVGLAAAVDIPPLDLTRREHFAPLLSALAQYDRAALVDPRGVVRTIGVALRPSPESVRALPPFRGTRHTSAQRFSLAEPTTVTFVVSSGGPLSVFFRGQRLGLDGIVP